MWVNSQYSEEFGVWVNFRQVSVLSPLCFILVLELRYADPWCILWTARRIVSPNTRCGRLAWQVMGFGSTWRRLSFWYPMLALLSSRNQESTCVLSAAMMPAITPSSALESGEPARGAVTSVPGLTARLIDGSAMSQVDFDSIIIIYEGATFCYLGGMLCFGWGCEGAIPTKFVWPR